MGATMTVKYLGHLLDDRGYYMGQPVQVARQYHRYVNIDKWQTVDVRLPCGTIVNIPMPDFNISYRVMPA